VNDQLNMTNLARCRRRTCFR